MQACDCNARAGSRRGLWCLETCKQCVENPEVLSQGGGPAPDVLLHRQTHWSQPALRIVSQVDDEYPSDRILLRERISVITFLSDTLLVKNQPCPDLATPEGLDHRRKLGHNTFQFAYLPGCAGAPGDLFVVRLPIVHDTCVVA